MANSLNVATGAGILLYWLSLHLEKLESQNHVADQGTQPGTQLRLTAHAKLPVAAVIAGLRAEPSAAC
jgi:hypothetical protein